MDVNEQSPRGINGSSCTRMEEDYKSILYVMEVWEELGIGSTKFQTFGCSSAMAEEWTFATEIGQVAPAPPAAGFMSEAEEMIGEALQVGPGTAECFTQRLLYGHSQEPRLPIFKEICPDVEEADDLQHNSTA